MKIRYMSCLFLSLVLAAPSLFCEEILTLYNNTIYPVTAKVVFSGSHSGVACEFTASCDVEDSYSLAPGKSEKITFPFKTAAIAYIKATVPEIRELIWESGKVGGKVVGMKIKRQAQSASLIWPLKMGGRSTSGGSFVINANRNNRHFINDVEHVQNLAIYRFIQ